MKLQSTLKWMLRLIISIILLQTLFYKFTAHPDSLHIFQELGVEPYGRIGLGIIELIVAVLIIIPRYSILGVLMSFMIMLGAIATHLLVIGVDVMDDGGGLFSLAIIVMIASLVYLSISRNDLVKQVEGIREKLKF